MKARFFGGCTLSARPIVSGELTFKEAQSEHLTQAQRSPLCKPGRQYTESSGSEERILAWGELSPEDDFGPLRPRYIAVTTRLEMRRRWGSLDITTEVLRLEPVASRLLNQVRRDKALTLALLGVHTAQARTVFESHRSGDALCEVFSVEQLSLRGGLAATVYRVNTLTVEHRLYGRVLRRSSLFSCEKDARLALVRVQEAHLPQGPAARFTGVRGGTL